MTRRALCNRKRMESLDVGVIMSSSLGYQCDQVLAEELHSFSIKSAWESYPGALNLIVYGHRRMKE